MRRQYTCRVPTKATGFRVPPARPDARPPARPRCRGGPCSPISARSSRSSSGTTSSCGCRARSIPTPIWRARHRGRTPRPGVLFEAVQGSAMRVVANIVATGRCSPSASASSRRGRTRVPGAEPPPDPAGARDEGAGPGRRPHRRPGRRPAASRSSCCRSRTPPPTRPPGSSSPRIPTPASATSRSTA